ncbi:DUF3575 domain-containing protein [Pontibacter sp. SGAir0037]|uniref:DUF3575 domain-containing protein n=1 Tax=Pontibacter sp. SGAir0037 TaxID=2571030 RepID=UPI0010CD1469|nr:DUF3575 domain-containing protein [Pontibacter sp. SGAir0037]QCR24533.1 hypothetical protein C1N53_20680 [Pontibacter sp. SGAir0037]
MKIKLLLTLLLLAKSFLLFAQDEAVAPDPRANAFKLNLLPLWGGSINVMYERKLNQLHSAGITLTAYPKRLTLAARDASSTYAVTGEFRFYAEGDALHGFYMNPYIKYRLRLHNEKEAVPKDPDTRIVLIRLPAREKEVWSSYGAGVTVGYQKIMDNGLALDVFGGAGYYLIHRLESNNSYTDKQKKEYAPSFGELRLGASLGYVF